MSGSPFLCCQRNATYESCHGRVSSITTYRILPIDIYPVDLPSVHKSDDAGNECAAVSRQLAENVIRAGVRAESPAAERDNSLKPLWLLGQPSGCGQSVEMSVRNGTYGLLHEELPLLGHAGHVHLVRARDVGESEMDVRIARRKLVGALVQAVTS